MELTIKTSISYKFSLNEQETKKKKKNAHIAKKREEEKRKVKKQNQKSSSHRPKAKKWKKLRMRQKIWRKRKKANKRKWTKSKGDAIKRFSLLSHYLPEFVFLSVGVYRILSLFLTLILPLLQPTIFLSYNVFFFVLLSLASALWWFFCWSF